MFDEQPDGDPHGECAAEIHRLRDALAFYANPSSYPNPGWIGACSAILDDGGEKARQAIAGVQPTGGSDA